VDTVAQLFAPNFFGAVAMIKAALPMLASSVAEHDRPRQLRVADARDVACADRCCGAKAVFGW
jgi:hypothetical protein